MDDIWKFIQEVAAERDELAYDIDGIVIKVNSLAMQEELVLRLKHHVGQSLINSSRRKEAEILSVDWTVGRTGVITPTAIDSCPTCGN